ncbi:MAG: diguanylate cyclase [Chloroflexi bacterium]|nr:diguanylate cyclase [Chloroflexota bacterium]
MEANGLSKKSEQVYARLGKELSATTNAETAAEIILNAAHELIGWEACYLILYDPEQGGKPRPLLAIDTIDNKQVVEHNVAPEKPSDNMLKAIRENGYLSLYDEVFEIPPALSFGDRSHRTLSQLFVPVQSGERIIGVLSIQSYQVKAYTKDSLEILKSLANHCAGALERIWAQEALAQMVERLKALYQATHAISASLDMEQLCDSIHAAVEKVMPCDDFVIDGYDEQTNEIVPVYAVEYPRRRVYTEKYFADHGMAGKIVHTRNPILLNSVKDMDSSGIDFELYGSALMDDPTKSLLAVPMLLHGKVFGMISAQSYKENAYTTEDQYLLELLAAHAAIAIENARLFAKAQHLADIDPLTGVLSRRKFFELAELEFSRSMRYDKPLSVIMLDVDEFKKFNDMYGHMIGDLVLKSVATQCRSSLREMDIFGRLGGEEFAAALPDTDLKQAVMAADRLRKVVEEADLTEAENLFDLMLGDVSKKEALKVTVSVGVAACDASCRNMDMIIDHADRAMYSVKYSGRNQTRVWNNGA